ncbi:TPA: hypothetical protein RG707_001361 [Serratia liquefaciens]|nr:hypothetical protein [Serratia liquefaciens]
MTTKIIGPHDYKTLFTEMPGGPEILDELTARFGKAIYVKGGHEADRETCYRAGQRSVLDFILLQLNRADGVNDDVEA